MIILVIVLIMISVAYFTLFERNVIGGIHLRMGPNKVGISGIFQPFRDALKLLGKEIFYPFKSNIIIYIYSPLLIYLLIIIIWILYPFFYNFLIFNNNILYILCIIRVRVYRLFFMGWSSNSIFSLIGAIRSIAQSISYEVIFALCLLIIFLITNILDLLIIKEYLVLINFLMFFPVLIVLFIRILAEVNRTPFDLSERESELVSGFNIEYGSGIFIIIFLSEYGRLIFIMILFNMIIIIRSIFFFIYLILLFFITWIRITMPRVRYDSLIYLCWFTLLPYLLVIYIFYLWIKFYIEIIYLRI